LKRWRNSSGVTDQPCAWRWQESQLRPLVPKPWKKALSWSMRPVRVVVCTQPEASGVVSGLPRDGSACWACVAPAPSSNAARVAASRRAAAGREVRWSDM